VGARISEQLDDQARTILNGPHGVRLEKSGGELVLHTTKIMDWFKDDFEKWSAGRVAFIAHHVTPDKRKQIEAAGNQVDLKFDDYDWSLNDASK
jgi:23S rRNA G2445 N2-methylase RlmL